MKNIIIAALKIIFIIIRNVVVINTNREFINSTSFRVIKIKKINEIFFFENKKIEIASKSKTQQFYCNKIRAMCKNENYYKILFEILMNKLIKMQIKNFVMQRIRI